MAGKKDQEYNPYNLQFNTELPIDTSIPLADKALRVTSNTELKLQNMILSIEEKAKLVEKTGLNKSRNLEGYMDGYIINSADGDTQLIEGADGSRFSTRLSDSVINYIDTVEIPHYQDYGYTQQYGSRANENLYNSLDITQNIENYNNAQTPLQQDLAGRTYEASIGFIADNFPIFSQDELEYIYRNGSPTPEMYERARTYLDEQTELRRNTLVGSDDIIGSFDDNKFKGYFQTRQVAELTGKRPEDLTNEDFINVGRFQQQRVLDNLRATQDGRTTSPYDPSITYTGRMDEGERIPVQYKITGQDPYGRPLVELVNPNTGQEVTFDLAKDPYLNASFNLSSALDTPQNRIKVLSNDLSEFLQKSEEVAYGDTDGRALETVDLAKAGLVRTSANILSLLPDGAVDFLDNAAKDLTSNYNIKALSDPETGTILADYIAGVRPSTRNAYSNNIDKATQQFVDGNYLQSIVGFATNVDRLLADSSAQLLLIGGSAAATGGSSILAQIVARGGMGLAVADMVGQNAKLYELNNDGQKYTADQYALDAALNFALLYPERIAVTLGINRYLRTPVRDALLRGQAKNLGANWAKATGLSTVGEFFQEALQNAEQEWITQNQAADIRRTAFEILQDPEIWAQGLAGGIAGGTLTGTAVGTGNIVSTVGNIKRNQYDARQEQINNTNTTSGVKTNQASNLDVASTLESIDPRSASVQTLQEKLTQLDNLQATEGLSIATQRDIQTKRADVIANAILTDRSVATQIQDKIGTFEEIVYYSDPNSQAIKNIDTIAKALDITEEQAKNIKQVELEAKYGNTGYIFYGKIIDSINNRLRDTSLSDSVRATLETERAGLLQNVARFFASQVAKLNSIAEAMRVFQTNPLQQRVDFSYTENRTNQKNYIKKSDILNYATNERKGIYAITNAASDTINALNNILTRNDENVPLDTYNRALENIQSVSDNIKQQASTYSQEHAKVKPTETVTKRLEKLANNFKKEPDKYRADLRREVDTYSDKRLDALIKHFKGSNDYVTDLLTKEKNSRTKRKERLAKEKDNANVSTQENSSDSVTDSNQRGKQSNSQETEIDLDEINARVQNEAIESTESEDSTQGNIQASETTENSLKKEILDTKAKYDRNVQKAVDRVTKDKTNIERYFILPNKNVNEEISNLEKLAQYGELSEEEQTRLDSLKEQLANAERVELINIIQQEIATSEAEIEILREEALELRDMLESIIDTGNKQDIRYLNQQIKNINKRINNIYKKNIFSAEQRIVSIANNFTGQQAKSILNNGIAIHTSSKFNQNAVDMKVELRPSKNPTTLLGEYQVNIANKAIINAGKELRSMLKLGDGNTFDRSKVQLKRSNETPAYALLFTNDNKLDPNTIFAIDYSVKEFILQSNDLFKPLDENTFEFLEAVWDKDLEGIDNTNVASRTLAANLLGEQVLDNLGLERNTTATKEGYERIVSSLGNIALVYAEGKGWIKDFTTPNQVDRNVHFIERTVSDDTKIQLTNEYEQLNDIRVAPIADNVPTPFPQKVKKVIQVHKNQGLTIANKVVHQAMEKLVGTKYTINTPAVDFVVNNIELIRDKLGFVPEEVYANQAYEDQISQKAKNLAIERQIQDLIDLSNKGNESGWFFNWFYSRNGRLNLDSNTVNMQSGGKDLQRFLVLPDSFNTNLSYDADMKAFNYAIAQAFSLEPDKKHDKAINEFADRIKEIPYKDIENALINGTLDKLGISNKIENIGHFLAGLEALKAYQEGKALGNKSFNTNLTAEFDSTTSGYAIRILQYPLSEMRKYYDKVGFLMDRNTTMHNLKGAKDFLDVYETIAKELKLPSVQNYQRRLDRNSKLSEFNKNYKNDLWIALRKVVPTNTVADGVSSQLRKLFKDPTMTFGYGQQRNNLSKGLAKNITHDIIASYMDIQNGTFNGSESDAKAIRNVIAVLLKYSKMNKAEFVTALRTKPLNQIRTGTEYNLETAMIEVLAETYGNAVYGTLENEFQSFTRINNYVGNAFELMFHAFEKKLNSLLANEPEGSKLTFKRENELIEEAFRYFPVIKTVFSNQINELQGLREGITIFDTERTINNNTKTQVEFNKDNPAFKDKDTNSYQTVANVRKLIAANLSGAVIPIHFIDGSVMSSIITDTDYDIFPIHDAIMVGLNNFSDAVNRYNEALYNINRNYDMFGEILTRLKDVYSNSDINPNHEIIKVLRKYIEPYNDKLTTKEKNQQIEITVSEYIEHMEDTYREILDAKDIFYNNEDIVITNMDGIEGSQYSVQEGNKKLDNEFKEYLKKENSEFRSDPYSYTTDLEIGDLQKINEGILTDTATRLDIMKRLRGLDTNNKISDSHFNHLEGLLRKYNSKRLEDLSVYVGSVTGQNFGKVDSKAVKIAIGSNFIRTGKSAAEIYTHEIVHALVSHVINNADTYKKRATVRRLMQLQKRALDNIEVTDLLPPNPSTEEYVQAQALWDYMFNNPDITNLRGLNEFIAHGITNEKIMAKLQSIKVIEEKQQLTLLDKLISHVNTLLDFLAGDISFKDIFVKDLNLTVYDSLSIAISDIVRADNGAITRLQQSPFKAVEKFFTILGKLKDKGDTTLSPHIKKLVNIADVLGVKIPEYKPEMNKYEQAKWLAKYIPVVFFSKKHREIIPLVLQAIGLSQQGTLQTLYRDINKPDYDSAVLEALSAKTRQVEQASKALESTVYRYLVDSFGRELTDQENTSLTKAVLYTDLQALTEDFSTSEIKSLLKDETKLSDQINKYKDTLRNDPNYNWYVGSAILLADYMTTGKGNEALAFNANNIATGFFTGARIEADTKTINNINKLATLLALQNADPVYKNLVAELDTKGLENYLQAHKTFAEESANDAIDKVHVVKGYTKQILDNSANLQVDSRSKQADYLAKGYKVIYDISESKITGRDDLVMYRSSFNDVRHRNGATFLLNGQHAMGTSLETISAAEFEADKNALHQIFLKNANKIQKQLVNYIKANGENIDLDKIKAISDNFSPIVNPYGEVVDYRITMANNVKETILKQNLNGLGILSKMYASKYTKENVPAKNQDLVNFLVQDMSTNYVDNSIIGRNNKSYIELKADSHNEFVRNAYKIMPRELRQYLHREGKPLAVREDWLQMLFGVPQISAIDFDIVSKHAPTVIKQTIQLAETFIRHVAYFAKQNIVIRTPKVLVGNIVSNINFSVMNGANLFTTIKKHFENSQNIRNYIITKRALNDIEFKERIGKASNKEISSKNWYRAKLENNPVHPLMEKGMYQAIVEDIAPSELEATGKVTKAIGKRIGNKVPKFVKEIGRQAYMTEGTPYFELMRTLTQYSDFVARATEYQFRMEKAPDRKTNPEAWTAYEEEVSHTIMDAFINYDKPSGALEQYVNDMGLVMFTKFSKRILHVLARSFTDKPVSGMVFLTGQALYWDQAFGGLMNEHIYEQVPWEKHYSALLHTPLDNAISTLIPSIVKRDTFKFL